MTQTTIPAPPDAAALDGAGGRTLVYAGTHRVRPPAETVDLAWGARAAAGISRVADITGLDTVGIPVFNTIRPRAASGTLTVSCGKGVDRTAALASALMEAIERHCGERHDRRGPVGSLRELSRADRVLHPRALILDRHTTWTEETEIEWWPYRNLTSDEVVLLPAAATFTPYPAAGVRMFGSVSDGLAAGNSLTEATLHALYELVERDCTAFGEVARCGYEIALDTLPAVHRGFVDRFAACGITTRVFAFETAVGIPAFFVAIDDTTMEDALLINGGAGCHLSPSVALNRALTEAAQSRLSVISGGREDLTEHVARRAGGYPAARQRMLAWASGWPVRAFGSYPDLSTGSLAEDLRLVRRRLAEAGLRDVYLTDLTLPGLPFAVVRAVVPGLEFFHQEPGRLGRRLHTVLRQRRLAAAGTPEAAQ